MSVLLELIVHVNNIPYSGKFLEGIILKINFENFVLPTRK